MKAQIECEECLHGLGRRMAKAACEKDKASYGATLEVAAAVVGREFILGRSVPTRVATSMFRAVVCQSNNPDPFARLKAEEYERGVAAAERLKRGVGDSIGELLLMSATGNRLDFFRDLAEVEAEWAQGAKPPAVDDRERLVAKLAAGSRVLILADNVGEYPFDEPLMEGLRRLGAEVVYAVKGKVSQNDLCIDDLETLGLTVEGVEGVEGIIDTGTDWVGCELSEVSREFRDEWESADLVISKGMANMETLTEYPHELRGREVFFVLVAKCEPVARMLGVKVGALVLAHADRVLGREVI